MLPTVGAKESKNPGSKVDVHKGMEAVGMQPALPGRTGQCHCKACLEVDEDEGRILIFGKDNYHTPP